MSEKADIDLLLAAAWHEDARMGYGDLFADEVEAILDDLGAGLREYSIRFDDVRRVNMERFSFALYYFLLRGEVIVLAILHTRMDVMRELRRRRLEFN